MNDEPNSELDPAERRALEAWGRDWTPPAALRDRTVAVARERGLIGGTKMKKPIALIASWAAAAAILAFVVGLGVGRRPGAAARPKEPSLVTTPATQTQFALMLFESSDYQAPAAGSGMTDRVSDYSRWARGIAESGRRITGEKLADDGRWCRMDAGQLVTQAPVQDPIRGALVGYFVLDAASLDEALEIARTCPHLKYGGSAEVRAIEGT